MFRKELERRDYIISGMEKRLKELEDNEIAHAQVIVPEKTPKKINDIIELTNIIEARPNLVEELREYLKKIKI